MTTKAPPVPMGGALVLIGIFWVVLVATIVWAYLQIHAPPGPGPAVAVQLVYDAEGMTRFLQKVQWVGLVSVGAIALLTVVGLAAGDRKD